MFIVDFVNFLPAMMLLQLALAVIFFLFGIAKFVPYEQEGTEQIVADHPMLRHGPRLLGRAGFSKLLGVVELTTAALLLIGLIWSLPGFLGGLIGTGTFVVTMSLMPFIAYSEPGAGKKYYLSFLGMFLIKDLGLLGACLVVAKYHGGLLT